MNELLFAVGCLVFFLVTGGVVLVGGHLLESMVEDNQGSVRGVIEPDVA